jgi:hypothetical protein
MEENNSQIIIYQTEDGKVKIETHLENETVWLSIEKIGELFKKSRSTINEHILNIYKEQELEKEFTMRKIGISDFSTKPTNFYNLDVIISVGYRVKSHRGVHFRKWATALIKEYLIKGFALNDDRFKTGNSMNYFNELQERIREIRISERFFYQKIKDIYTTSIDYNPKDENTILFFKVIQNKLLWAISQQTAAELVYRRADANLPLLGMQSYDKDKKTNIKKQEVSVAKNYLKEGEIKLLGLIVEQYLAFAETMALENTPMYMKDWVSRLDAIVQLNGKELLTHAGEISHQKAVEKSSDEFEKYKEAQKQIEKEMSIKELEEDLSKLTTNLKSGKK